MNRPAAIDHLSRVRVMAITVAQAAAAASSVMNGSVIARSRKPPYA